jgi:7-cyano-7-deazaguanine synthase
MMPSSALVVFSGGQDSSTCLLWALKNFAKVTALTFDYGQRHRVEITQARAISAKLGVVHEIVKLDFFSQLAPNALTDPGIAVAADGGMANLPSTFVPGRNAIFLSVAASRAIALGISDIVTGLCQSDYSGYPDCRENFLKSICESMSLALDTKIEMHAPLMHLSKKEAFQFAFDLGGLDLVIKESQTCYEGDREHLHEWGYGCGRCPACLLRENGFKEYKENNRGSQNATG